MLLHWCFLPVPSKHSHSLELWIKLFKFCFQGRGKAIQLQTDMFFLISFLLTEQQCRKQTCHYKTSLINSFQLYLRSSSPKLPRILCWDRYLWKMIDILHVLKLNKKDNTCFRTSNNERFSEVPSHLSSEDVENVGWFCWINNRKISFLNIFVETVILHCNAMSITLPFLAINYSSIWVCWL